MNQSSSLGFTFAIVFRCDAVGALPDDSSAEQSYHTDDGKDDGCFVPDHSCVLGMRECAEGQKKYRYVLIITVDCDWFVIRINQTLRLKK